MSEFTFTPVAASDAERTPPSSRCSPTSEACGCCDCVVHFKTFKELGPLSPKEDTCKGDCRNLDHIIKLRLAATNATLATLHPRAILHWLKCLQIDEGNIVQFTSFGLPGVVITHLLDEVQLDCPVVFIDTLHHFDETLALRDHYVAAYGDKRKVLTYHSETASTRAEFDALHGADLWATDTPTYDYLAKVEPTFRALFDLKVKVWITGRRRSQGDLRSDLKIIEVQADGIVKINPLAFWSFSETFEFAKANNIRYNELLDKGYKSIGDTMSTLPVAPDAPERSGRWSADSTKTECGMHTANPARALRRASLAAEKEKALAAEQDLSTAAIAAEVFDLGEAASPTSVDDSASAALSHLRLAAGDA